MSDIVEKLRRKYSTGSVNYRDMVLANPDGEEAAATIERLTKERDEARLQDPNQWRREYWGHYNDLKARADTLAAELAKVEEELDKIAALITPSNFFHEREIGDLIGWCERVQKRIRSLKGGKS